MERKLLLYALPFFALSILIDFYIDHRRRTGRYRIVDSITSLNIGFLGTALGSVTAGAASFIYYKVWLFYHIFNFRDSFASFILAAIAWDFFFYLNHRAHHRINFFWAAHSTHHNSQFFNFTTALRQSSFTFITFLPFFLPMAILGFTVQQYLFGSAVSVIYGFYTHTEALGSIPYFEFIFVGPMSHKVHHGVNPRYIDKNYGSILNIWDRMFRTYESERLQDPVYYGTLAPLRSFNPLKANFQVYQALWKDAKNTRQWKDKIGLWFRETGWRPDDLAVLPKTPYGQLTDGRLRNEFHKPPNDASMVYVLIHFLAATLFTAYLMVTAHLHSRGFVSVYVATLSWGLVGIALVLERKRFAFKLEAIRSVFFIPIGLFASHSAVLLDHTVYISVALFGIFNLALLLAWKSKLDLKPILLDQKRLIEPA